MTPPRTDNRSVRPSVLVALGALMLALLWFVLLRQPWIAGVPPTWALWRVTEERERATPPGGPPDTFTFAEIERGLDRTACELVLQKHARGFQSAFGGRQTSDGVIYHTTGDILVSTYLVCLREGERPQSPR